MPRREGLRSSSKQSSEEKTDVSGSSEVPPAVKKAQRKSHRTSREIADSESLEHLSDSEGTSTDFSEPRYRLRGETSSPSVVSSPSPLSDCKVNVGGKSAFYKGRKSPKQPAGTIHQSAGSNEPLQLNVAALQEDVGFADPQGEDHDLEPERFDDLQVQENIEMRRLQDQPTDPDDENYVAGRAIIRQPGGRVGDWIKGFSIAVVVLIVLWYIIFYLFRDYFRKRQIKPFTSKGP